MVRLISQVQESLCNKYYILTLNAGKAERQAPAPAVDAIAVPTLREVMQQRYDVGVIDGPSPLGGPRIDTIMAPAKA